MQSEIEVCRRSRAVWSFGIISLGVASLLPAKALLPGSLLGLVALVMFVSMSERTHEGERARMLALLLLLVLQLGFWIAFARVEALALSVSEFESGAALERLVVAAVLVLAPVVTRLWRFLAAYGLEPSLTAKFSIGFLCLAASCTCLAAVVEWSPLAVGLGSVALCLVALVVAASILGPACVSAIFELSPLGQQGTAMAGWVFAYVFARALGSWAQASQGPIFETCLALGFGAAATAVLSSFMWHGLQTLTATPVPVGAIDHSLGGSPVSVGGSLGAGVGSGSLG
jgi:dipeptide/tripeptide permease